ncbi:MAG: sulfite exporter TauE/SafE family protein [Candidatus Daviesbacteria bacterium]|nr:sulfite exporter TauE/SafE family protein [Candidatus Daviesbacteria bacterium]
MHPAFFTLILGFVLGIKHAFEPDHMIAVSTIVVEQKNPLKAALVGTFWGLGHTTALLLTGILVLLLKLSIPEKLSLTFELFVGVMLVILGIRALHQSRLTFHAHQHGHEDLTHQHLHLHGAKVTHRKHHTSFFIGTIHGLAGSGALMLLVLSTIPSLTQGLYYILLFGLGSTLGMTVMSFLIGLPFIFSASKFPQMEKYLRIFAGTLSILFGLFWIYELLFLISNP